MLADRLLNISIECRALTPPLTPLLLMRSQSGKYSISAFSPNGSVVVGASLASRRSEIAAPSSRIKSRRNWMG